MVYFFLGFLKLLLTLSMKDDVFYYLFSCCYCIDLKSEYKLFDSEVLSM